jgi:hypothetical protein
VTDLIKSSGQFVAGFVPPDYLVDGVLQRRFCYSMTAQTGVGKTAVAMLITAHVATGRSLGTLDVAKGSVIYFAGENPTDIQMRWLGLTQEMAIDPATADVHFIEGVVPLLQTAEQISLEVTKKNLQPALVIVDTAAAYFQGDNDNDNTQQGDYARLLRSLTKLPGGPCVLVLCHPTKRAGDDDLIPKGGGAFLNEVDGNIALRKKESQLGAEALGKFRGPTFEPIYFELKAVRHPLLKDTRGRNIPTVVARAIGEAERAAVDAASERDEDRVLRLIETHPRASLRTMGSVLGWKNHSKVERFLKTLMDQKLIKREGRSWKLTQAGEKELNAQDQATVPSLSQGHFPLVPLPPVPVR